MSFEKGARLLRREPDELADVQKLVQSLARQMEALVRKQHIEQMPVFAAQLDALGGAHGILPDDLVQLLAILAERHGAHENILGREEGKLLAQMLFHHARIDLAAAHHIGAERQNGVAREKTLRQRETAVCGIVQRALEPLGHGGVRGVGREIYHVPAERAHALAAHGIALVGHRGGADLLSLKRLVQLAQMREKAHIGRHFGGALRDAGENVHHEGIELSCIRLPGDGDAVRNAHLFRDLLLQREDLVPVAVEEGEKARRGAGSALAAGNGQTGKLGFQLLQVKQKILQPERRALADGCWLRGLEVRPGERRRVGLARGKFGKRVNDRKQLAADELERCAHLQKVGVVIHIAARCAEMDDARGLRAGIAERTDVRHHVVAQAVLIFGGTVKIDIVEMRAHFLQLLIRNGQPQLLLTLGEREPETAERGKLPLRGEEVLHLLGGIARAQGIFVNVFHVYHSTVTDLARLRGLSMSQPLHRATW